MLEVASESTAKTDTGKKRNYYAALGIPEYWRFDHTGGDFHGAALAGDMLVGNRYVPIQLNASADGIVQGYSAALNLFLMWDHGELVFIDPATEAPIFTYQYQQARAERAEERADRAEQRVRELEEENRRLRGEDEAQ